MDDISNTTLHSVLERDRGHSGQIPRIAGVASCVGVYQNPPQMELQVFLRYDQIIL